MGTATDQFWPNNLHVALVKLHKNAATITADEWEKINEASSIVQKQDSRSHPSFNHSQDNTQKPGEKRQRTPTLDHVAEDLNNSLEDTSVESEDTHTQMMKTSIDRQWSMGRVSLLLLLLVSMTDVILHLADAKMDSLQAITDYDALSSEVIRPAFQYTSQNQQTASNAMPGSDASVFSSLTFVLDPIISSVSSDNSWLDGVVESFTSVMLSARESLGISDNSDATNFLLSTPRGGTSISSTRKRKTLKKSHHTFALSSSEPFISLKDIAQMTLRDVAMEFRYALESTRKDFNRGKFTSKASPRVKKAFDQMSAAAAQSRGKHVKIPTTTLGLTAGDIDALQFCAAMRIFAEWRVLRQVPEGYKGYSVGMSLGQKDVVQNVAKIEHAVHSLIEHRENELTSQEGSEEEVLSPTLRDLLQFEVDSEVHGTKLPKLKEKSGAMGLLWVRRQLHYQTEIFTNVIKVPKQYGSTRAAVSAAYNEVYDKFHGWAVQKIFNYSFQAAPEGREIYNYMNPEKLKEATEDLKSAASKGDVPRVSSPTNKEEGNPLDRFGKHVSNEWGKLIRVFSKSESKFTVAYEMNSNNEANAQDYIDNVMKTDAHEAILVYLDVAQPLLLDLANLFDEFDMDDPTKV